VADPQTGAGMALAVASAITLNWAYVQEHDAASRLPPLSLRHPVRTVRLLLASPDWLRGMAGETTGFALYVGALALAPLSLVQSVAAGGIAVLAYVSARHQGRAPSRRERAGVAISLTGLLALGASLAGSTGHGHDASFLTLAAWLAACGLVALGAVAAAGRFGRGVPYAMAAGILLACGDVSMKGTFEGGGHVLFLITGAIGYGVGTILLQISYQHAQALTAAGISTLLTNAIPIAAATTILGEQIPSGPLGALRILAFFAVIAGGVALARGAPQPSGQGAAQVGP